MTIYQTNYTNHNRDDDVNYLFLIAGKNTKGKWGSDATRKKCNLAEIDFTFISNFDKFLTEVSL
jgi:hypothetical protein